MQQERRLGRAVLAPFSSVRSLAAKLARLKPLDESDQCCDREAEIARAGVLHRIVADAAAAAHEQHADRAEPGHRLPVVAGARTEPQPLGTKRTDRGGEAILHGRMT